MTPTTRFLAALALAAGLSGTALAGGTGHHHHGGHAPAGGVPATHDADHDADMAKMIDAMKTSPGDTASTLAYKAADMAMMHDMHVPYTGDPDVDFRTHMIPHHQGAIAMAKVALQHAKDPQTKRLAEQIIADQDKEIAQMRDWLAKNRK
ncbi:DUF305 domain-containing protein [Methylobacterium sp. Leaf108]|uniref:CopM family metallochaperone n=1 Tax=Methylobacterium sp. Leaf108 TaxID=1736256 RepID=UPI0006F3E965|nr:DUF305 domain-containing protein [Methylobacterium sp. Leaf108]KQP61617.1 hypothetical protein ASF39_02805 [Methylobacterium sp. Leaf108]